MCVCVCDKHSHVSPTWESVVGGGLGLWYVNHSEAPSLICNQNLACPRGSCFPSVSSQRAAPLNPDNNDDEWTPNEQEHGGYGRIDKQPVQGWRTRTHCSKLASLATC